MSFLHPPRALLASALILLLGCQAETFGADDIVVDPATMTLEGTRLPGGLMTLSAPWLPGAPGPFAIVVDQSTEVEGIRTPGRADQISFRLPDAIAPGSHTLEIRAAGTGKISLATITTGGFSAIRYAVGSLVEKTQSVSGLTSLAGLLYDEAGQPCDVHIGLLDLRTATLKIPEGSTVCGHFGIGSSTRPRSFTVSLGQDLYWRSAGVALNGFVIDSADLWGGTYLVHELAPGIFLDAGQHEQTMIWGPAVDNVNWAQVGGYQGLAHVAVTDDGDWAIPDHYGSDSGVLIIDRTSGAHHWSPHWGFARTAAGDDAAYVLGYRDAVAFQVAPVWLGRIDPSTGTLLDSVPVTAPSGEPYLVSTGRVYTLESAHYLVLVFPVDGYWELSFRDPLSLAEVARAKSPVAANGCFLSDDPWLVEDPGADRFYLTATHCSGNTPILTFELPE